MCTTTMNMNVMFDESNYTFEQCNGSYQNFVLEAARVFNLDPQMIYTGSIKVFYYDFVDWIRISSDEELAMSFVYKDPNTPLVLRMDDSMKNVSGASIESNFDSNRNEKKKGNRRRKEREANDDIAPLNSKQAIEREQRNNAVYVDDTSTWPENVTHLFIDGNNILYMTKTLRDNTLKRKLYRAQELIVAATEFFASRMTGLKDVYVIFDNISTTYEKTLENGTNLFIRSARPNFSTTDDMLVNWSEQNKTISPNSLHITSDRALCGRLNIEGSKVMKPKAFFNLTLKLTNQENENVDSWFSKLEENL